MIVAGFLWGRASKSIILSISAFLLFALPVISFNEALSWHDQQRVGQIFLIALAFFWFLVSGWEGSGDKLSLSLLLGIFFLAIVSSVLASQPLWSLIEVALFVGCFFVVCVSRDIRNFYGGRADEKLVLLISLVVVAICVKFLVSYFAAVIFRGSIDPMLLFDGFSWPRFLGQFQTLSLSLLVLPFLCKNPRGCWLLFLCAFWWFATIAAGTRASWLGMAVAMLIIPLIFKQGWRYTLLQVCTAMLGGAFYLLLMKLVPQWLALPTGNLADDRLTTSLSGREALWGAALEMILASPLFGYGPMHFAELAHPYGAHPHQAVLQWASEWGVPSAIIVGVLLVRSFLKFLVGGFDSAGGYFLCLCLSASFIASAAHAMVDGSLVMPYTQVWLSILIGWGWGFWRAREKVAVSVDGCKVSSPAIMVMAVSVAILLAVVVRDAPGILSRESYDSPPPWRDAPRFWQEGIIKKRDF